MYKLPASYFYAFLKHQVEIWIFIIDDFQDASSEKLNFFNKMKKMNWKKFKYLSFFFLNPSWKIFQTTPVSNYRTFAYNNF